MPGGNPRSQVAIDLNSIHILHFVVEVNGVTDIHYASLNSQGVQHKVFYLDGHPSRYQRRPTGLNFGEQTGTGVFPYTKKENVPTCRKNARTSLIVSLMDVTH